MNGLKKERMKDFKQSTKRHEIKRLNRELFFKRYHAENNNPTQQENQYIFYIGSDNKTHKLSSEYINKCVGVLNRFFDGYTLETNLLGYWKGTQKESIKVTVISEQPIKDSVLNECSNALKLVLKQHEIIISYSEIALKRC